MKHNKFYFPWAKTLLFQIPLFFTDWDANRRGIFTVIILLVFSVMLVGFVQYVGLGKRFSIVTISISFLIVTFLNIMQLTGGSIFDI